MKKERKTRVGRIVSAGLLTLAALILSAGAVFHAWAAYAAITQRSRTVSTWKDTGSFFTSNYLHAIQREDAAASYTTIVVGGTEDRVGLAVYVCNYNRMAADAPVTPESIRYRFRMTVCGGDKAPLEETGATWTWSDFSVQVGETVYVPESNSLSVDDTLNGGAHEFTVFNVSFPAGFDGYLLLEALPVTDRDYEVSNQTKLGCFVTTSLDRSLPNAWTGKLTGLDNVEEDTVIDGFNYEISGSGEREYTLSWDTSHVELSQWNVLKYGLEVTADGTTASAVLSLPLGSEDDLFHTYELQFYRTSAQTPGEDPASWITFTERE